MERLHGRSNFTDTMEVLHVRKMFSLLFAGAAGLAVPVALGAV